MALATWWKNDPLPLLPPLPGFRVEVTEKHHMLAQLAELPLLEVRGRVVGGHRPYLAYMGDTPVAYGWVATRQAEIGELNMLFTIPPTNRYLWDFQTLPEWRGLGLYPRLLQAIIAAEMAQGAERFWIIYAPENRPSAAGITRAGFSDVGELSFIAPDKVRLAPEALTERARAGAFLLEVGLLNELPLSSLSSCWHCVIESGDMCRCGQHNETSGSAEAVCGCGKS